MQSILNKIREDISDRIVEVFWIAIKTAVVTVTILVILQIIPIHIRHAGDVEVKNSGLRRRSGGSFSVSIH